MSNKRSFLNFFLLITLSSILLLNIVGCDRSTHKEQQLASQGYEYVYSKDNRSKVKKVQIFCPGKTLTYMTSDYDSIVSSCGSNCSTFDEYSTGLTVYTSCPIVVHPVVQKKNNQLPIQYNNILNTDNAANNNIEKKSSNKEDGSNVSNSIIINNNVGK